MPYLLAYPWQPAEAQAVANQFCVDRGYQAAGAMRPLTLPAALIQQVRLPGLALLLRGLDICR